MTWITSLVLTLGALAVGVGGLVALGRARWNMVTQTLLGQLEATRRRPTTGRYDAAELEGLPAPVQRYFRAVLRDGQAIVMGANMRHTGTFNLSALGNRDWWIPFSSKQQVLTNRPGFVWSARMALAPGIAVLVHDAYASGAGTLHPSILGLFSLATQHGSGEIARGELMRYMVEAAWYPTALLPSQGTEWVAIDDASAAATMVDGGISMSMRFTFDAGGLIESVRADARGALICGKLVMMPWEGSLSNYQERAGMLVPLTGEAAWLTPGGRKPYWRGVIVATTYEFAG